MCGATVRSSAAFSNHEEKRPFFHSWGLLHEIDFFLSSCEARARENESLFFLRLSWLRRKKGDISKEFPRREVRDCLTLGYKSVCLSPRKRALVCPLHLRLLWVGQKPPQEVEGRKNFLLLDEHISSPLSLLSSLRTH